MRARLVWGSMRKLLLREGADRRVEAIFYRTVVQEIILYGSETWVITT